VEALGGTLAFETTANSVLVLYIFCCWMKAAVLSVWVTLPYYFPCITFEVYCFLLVFF
jgi:hypothetical protein